MDMELDIYNDMAITAYEIWEVTVPYSKLRWKAVAKACEAASSKGYFAGSGVQFMDFLLTSTGDGDIIHEKQGLIVKTDVTCANETRDMMLLHLDSPP